MFPVLLLVLGLWLLHCVGWLVPIAICLSIFLGIALVYTAGAFAVVYLLESLHSSED